MSSPPQLEISQKLLAQIHAHGEQAYPEEGAGFLLGSTDGERRQVSDLIMINNSREDGARHNRYLISAQDVMSGEDEAELVATFLLGVAEGLRGTRLRDIWM